MIFLSELLKSDFKQCINVLNRSYVLNNFIEDSFFGELTKNRLGTEFKIVAVGTIREQKNYSFLLEVFDHLKDYDITLDIYGGGDFNKLKYIIEEKGLKGLLQGSKYFITRSLARV